ncbi:MAG: malonic semialdehyde reductase [Pseudomonadota bacterium]
MTAIDSHARNQILGAARTHSTWQHKPVSHEVLRQIYDLARMGPTSANSCPARFVFVTSDAGRARLKPHLGAGNVDKTMAAPVTVIIGYDLEFYEHMSQLFPHEPDARSWFTGSDQAIYENALRNGTLQAAYLMVAARAHGLDCGPMSGFDNAGVDAEFWPDSSYRSNFLCNLGYGVADALLPRSPRFDFADVCEMA